MNVSQESFQLTFLIQGFPTFLATGNSIHTYNIHNINYTGCIIIFLSIWCVFVCVEYKDVQEKTSKI